MSFLDAVAAAQQVARTVSGGEVTYARGNLTVTLTAGRGRSSFDVVQGDVLTRIESRDFLVAAADLQLAGVVQTLPERGDTITETDADGTELKYELLERQGEPVWRYSDEYRLQIRIHTKLIQ